MKPFEGICKSAKGLKGFLLKDLGGDLFFRVYNEDKSFTDYEIWHSDLEIEIVDSSAATWIPTKGPERIDYIPKVLGRNIPMEEA